MVTFNFRGHKVQIERWNSRFGIIINGVRSRTALTVGSAINHAIDDINWLEDSK